MDQTAFLPYLIRPAKVFQMPVPVQLRSRQLKFNIVEKSLVNHRLSGTTICGTRVFGKISLFLHFLQSSTICHTFKNV